MSETYLIVIVLVVFAAGYFLGYLIGFCKGHDQCMDAWKRADDFRNTQMRGM